MASRSDTTVRFDEILVNIGPRPGRYEPTNQDAEKPAVRDYDVTVYTNRSELRGSVPRPGRYPSSIGGLPLVSLETIKIRWHRYDEYLELFLDAEKSARVMRERLLELFSSGLETIFESRFAGPTRIWWNCLSPELEELPWELLGSNPSGIPVSLARGVPGDLAPLIPISGPLRLGIVGANAAPPRLRDLGTGVNGITATAFDGPISSAIARAIREGSELVHVFTNGRVSLGFDSVLELAGSTISPGQLHSCLTGSRTALMSFSLTHESENERDVAKTTYSAFSHLGGGGSTTTLLAPIGPIQPSRAADFWHSFYETFPRSLSIEDALLEAQHHRSAPVPIALFLRHRLGYAFTRRPASASVEPQRLDAEVRVSRDILESISKIQKQSKREMFRSGQLDEVRNRLDAIDAGLDDWRTPDGGSE